MASSTSSDVTFLNAKFVIIGGGIAGVSCAEQLALEEPQGDVILISASPLVKVARNVNNISDRIQQFDVEEESHTFLEKCYPNCRVISAFALEINDEKHEIYLSNKQIVNYKRLCICSGAVPKVISESSRFVLGIRDTETVEVFQKKLSNARRVLIVGNGGIAIELAYEIENCQIIWAIKDKSVGATFFDAGAAKFFLPCLNEGKQPESFLSKRLNYDLEGSCISKSTMGSALGPDWSLHVNLKGKTLEKRNIHVEYECEVKNLYEREDFLKKKLKETYSEQSEDTDCPKYTILKPPFLEPQLINAKSKKQSQKRKADKEDSEGFAFPMITARLTTRTKVLEPLKTQNTLKNYPRTLNQLLI
ncbi:pyridine nucleotide-disulfide oxidoreductase domain-containing protein 1 [Trichonephila clavipes]|nr:pyridine nucleotide-disulfide oxidoreductase domain-containing protein 1 [Trichonephila clavipes]